MKALCDNCEFCQFSNHKEETIIVSDSEEIKTEVGILIGQICGLTGNTYVFDVQSCTGFKEKTIERK